MYLLVKFVPLWLTQTFPSDSKDWQYGGRDNVLLCSSCHSHFSKHRRLPPVPKPADPPYLFKPVKEEEEGLGVRHGMKTRRSRVPPHVCLSLCLLCHAYMCKERYSLIWTSFICIPRCHLFGVGETGQPEALTGARLPIRRMYDLMDSHPEPVPLLWQPGHPALIARTEWLERPTRCWLK